MHKHKTHVPRFYFDNQFTSHPFFVYAFFNLTHLAAKVTLPLPFPQSFSPLTVLNFFKNAHRDARIHTCRFVSASLLILQRKQLSIAIHSNVWKAATAAAAVPSPSNVTDRSSRPIRSIKRRGDSQRDTAIGASAALIPLREAALGVSGHVKF